MTILFLDDWKHTPGAIIDTETTNKSFIRLAALYRDMGIKNHSFLLALHDRTLQGVDPLDPNLSIEQMYAIGLECKSNFWYYIREIARVPGSGLESQHVKANRGNIALYWLFLNHVTTVLIQPRQTGKSFSVDQMAAYVLNISNTDTYMAMMTKDDILRSRALNRLKGIMDELPYYLKQKTKVDIANTEEISIKRLGNTYKGMLSNKSEKSAHKAARGLTSHIFHIDELAFIDNIDIVIPAAIPSVTAARAIAESKNEPYGIIYTTTAGKKDDKDGKYAYELVHSSATWSEHFMDSENPKELEAVIRNNSTTREFRVNCTFNHRQLGYTDEWLREQMELSRSTGEAADMDYFNIWSSGSQSSPFSSEQADLIRASQIVEPYVQIVKPYNYIVRWYIPLNQIEQRLNTSHYVLSLDTSDAIGNDDLAMVLQDITTGEVIAASNVNETNLLVYTEWLSTWLIKYDNITFIPERKSSGPTMIDILTVLLIQNDINPFKRIFNMIVQEKDTYPERFEDIDKRYSYDPVGIVNKYKKHFGWATSSGGITSRSELYSTTLLNSIKTTHNTIRDTQLIDQMLSLVIKNNRVDHVTGKHDDLVIAFLLGHWLITQGRGLYYYGMNVKDIMKNNVVLIKEHTSGSSYDYGRQQYIQKQIEDLLMQISEEKEDSIVFKLELRLRKALSELDSKDATYAVDQLLQNIKDSKKLRRRLKDNNSYNGYRRY